MQRGNGAVLGKANTPTASVASGVWALNEVQRAVLAGIWPVTAQPDPYFEYVTMLLHGDGTNGGQNNTFLDSSSNNFTITRNGNTTQGSFSPYGDLWSNYFDGSGDYLTASSSLMAYGTANKNSDTFTCEAWIYLTTYGSPSEPAQSMSMISKGDINFTWGVYSDGKLVVYSYDGTTRSSFSSGTIPLNTWVNVAFTVSGGVITHYINGSSSGTGTWYGMSSTSADLRIGRVFNTYWNGYISNLRISTIARSISLPTTNYTSDGNTALLTCQSNRFIDNSSNAYALTRYGDTRVTNFAPFNPTSPYSTATNGGSGYFDGNGDYLQVANDTSLNIGSGNFTLEAWVYINAWDSSGTNNIISKWNTGGSGYAYKFCLRSAGTLRFGTGNNGSLSTEHDFSYTFSLNTWYHVAVTRSGSTITAWVNGSSIGTATNSNTLSSNAAVTVGCSGDGGASQFQNGYISSGRLVVGTAVYTGAFTPNTTPLTAISGTSLLLNFTNASIVDNAMKNDLETVGNAQISTSTKKYGTGSMYFDGSGDYLYVPSNPANALGTGDFTVECWVNAASTPSDVGIFESRTLGDSGIQNGFTLTAFSSSVIRIFSDGALITSSGTSYVGTWCHVAVVRASGTWTLYINGVSQGTSTASRNMTNTDMVIGAGRYTSSSNPSAFFNGYIDDFRISRYARYTANFTPPTAPFPDF